VFEIDVSVEPGKVVERDRGACLEFLAATKVNAETSAGGATQEHDRVVLSAPVPDERLEVGDVPDGCS
jgi:hypothetical protein